MYSTGSSLNSQVIHWLFIAHLRRLFISGARDVALDLQWSQSSRHKNTIPDAVIEIPGRVWKLEVDNSTEGMRLDRIAGKADGDTLIVCFRSRERMDNLSMLPGLQTYHGMFHDKEDDPGFNLLTEQCWWDGGQWVSLL